MWKSKRKGGEIIFPERPDILHQLGKEYIRVVNQLTERAELLGRGGSLKLQVVVDSVDLDLPVKLRQLGFGVTSWVAEGRDGPRLMMQVLTKRTNEKKLWQHIYEIAPKAFVISLEPKQLKGCFWVKRLRP